MPWFPLQTVQTEYELTPGNRFAIYQHSLRVDVGNASWINPHCFFDSGAPFSVVSHTVAKNIGAALTQIPFHRGLIPTFVNGAPVPPTSSDSLLGWWDPMARTLIPCTLAEMSIRFRSTDTGVVSNPLRLVAKVLQAPVRAFQDRFLLLGIHLLTANAGRLSLDGQPWGLGGQGIFFPP